MTAGQLDRKHSTEDTVGIRPEADVRMALGSTMLHGNSNTSGLASFSELDWAGKHVSWPEIAVSIASSIVLRCVWPFLILKKDRNSGNFLWRRYVTSLYCISEKGGEM